MFLSIACASTILLSAASRTCGARPLPLLLATFKGLLLPSTACAALALAVLKTAPGTWPAVLAASAAGGAAYAAALYLWGGRAEERAFADQLPGMSVLTKVLRWVPELLGAFLRQPGLSARLLHRLPTGLRGLLAGRDWPAAHRRPRGPAGNRQPAAALLAGARLGTRHPEITISTSITAT